MVDIVAASDESDVEGGINRGLGGEGLLDNCWSQALAACRRDFLFDSHSDANCCYLDHLNLWASVAQYEPGKGRSSDGGPVASLMIKSAKDGGEEEEEESSHNWNCLPSPCGGSS